MRIESLAPAVIAVGLVVGARAVGGAANDVRARWPEAADAPYAPSPGAAPYVTLGYRELATDLLWIRALAYFGADEQASSEGVRNLVSAMNALDPRFEEVYVWSSLATQSIAMQLDNDDLFGTLAILERGMEEFPDRYELPLRAGEIYAFRLRTDDPAQQRRWKEEGARLIGRAVRLPNAPKSIGTYVAHLESELGQRDKAIRELQELIAYTNKPSDRDKLVKKLAKLTAGSSDAIAHELDVARARFTEAWRRERPELPATMYVVAGPPLGAWFEPAELAVEPVPEAAPIEPLPALADDVGEVQLQVPPP